MKQAIAAIVVTVAVCLAAPAAAQYGGTSYGGASGPADANSVSPSGLGPTGEGLPPDPEGKAEDLRLNGQCDEAIPLFRRIASLGAGYEIANYNLGLCLLDVSKTESDAARAESLRQAAARSILNAANAGIPKAQAALVTMYLDGVGVAPDPMAAGTWALIYHANGARFALGLPNISDSLQARLDSVLNGAAWAQAQARANAWAPTTQARQ